MNMVNKDLEIKAEAASLANTAVGGYVAYGEGDPAGDYAYALDIFNKVASPEKKAALKKAQDSGNDHLCDAQAALIGGDVAKADREDNLCCGAKIQEAEIMAEVITAAYAGAEKDMV